MGGGKWLKATAKRSLAIVPCVFLTCVAQWPSFHVSGCLAVTSITDMSGFHCLIPSSQTVGL